MQITVVIAVSDGSASEWCQAVRCVQPKNAEWAPQKRSPSGVADRSVTTGQTLVLSVSGLRRLRRCLWLGAEEAAVTTLGFPDEGDTHCHGDHAEASEQASDAEC